MSSRRACGSIARALGACVSSGLLLLALSCSGGAEPPTVTEPFDEPPESLVFEFDGREWSAVTRERKDRRCREVFTLPGETEEEWTELVTRILSFGAQRGTSLPALLKAQQLALEQECPIVRWEILELERRSALYEWSRPQCKELGPQTEIGRFAFGRMGIHKVTYNAKTARLAPGLRRQWVEALRAATLVLERPDAGDADDSAAPEAG